LMAGRLHFLLGEPSTAVRMARVLTNPGHHCQDTAPFCGDRLRVQGLAMQVILYTELGETAAAGDAQAQLSQIVAGGASRQNAERESTLLIRRLRSERREARQM
jgi:hypothetical protein